MTPLGLRLWGRLSDRQKAALADFLLFGSHGYGSALRLGVTLCSFRDTMRVVHRKFGVRGRINLLRLCVREGIYPE